MRRRTEGTGARGDAPPARREPRPAGCVAALRLLYVVCLPAAVWLGGCQSAPKAIFPEVSPPLVWPPPPDVPRIRYVGELRGEESLGVRARGWEAVRAAVGGSRPPGAFSRPCAVAVAGERVFVADTGLGVVHLLDLEGRRYLVLRGAPGDPLRVPIDVAIVGADRLAVVDRGRGALDIFDTAGNWLMTRRWPELAAPVAAAWDVSSGLLWVADGAAHACLGCRDMEQLVQRIGGRGSGPGQLNFPTGIACHPAVGLVVADAMNFRVQVFDGSGAPLAAFGQKGDAAGDFSLPRDVAVDSEGHIYVLDSQFENVQIFDGAGRLLLAFGQGGSGPGEFSLPAGIAIDKQDRIWVADSYNRRVQVFQYLREAGGSGGSMRG